jgi:hypothetical protein
LTSINQLRLYHVLGPEKAHLATPIMVEGGEVKWYSYIGESKGQEGKITTSNASLQALMSLGSGHIRS